MFQEAFSLLFEHSAFRPVWHREVNIPIDITEKDFEEKSERLESPADDHTGGDLQTTEITQ
jgi:hypothetical protein